MSECLGRRIQKKSEPAPVHPGMGSPFERWKHLRPDEHCPSKSHSPVQAFRFLALAMFSPESVIRPTLQGGDISAHSWCKRQLAYHGDTVCAHEIHMNNLSCNCLLLLTIHHDLQKWF